MLRNWGTLVLLLLVAPSLALAQSTGKIAGRVTDATTGETLPGANVVLEGTLLGATTDVDGNYFIIGVPVGTYNVQASFVGFQTQTVENVDINAGYTRELNFELSPGVELEEIVVEYERPLIQKDAIGAPRVVTGEELTNLPVRGVANVAALQSGVVANEGSTALYVRGGREEEVDYYVDGVRVIGQIAVPQQSIEEQEMLIGTIPARYGDAMGGIISITTKTGGPSNFFGSIEAISSEVLDPFGYNLGSISLGGPIVPRKLSFFVSAEGTLIDDNSPFVRDVLALPEETLLDLNANPQVIRLADANGNKSMVPFPGDIHSGMTLDELEAMLEERGIIGGNTGFHLDDPNPDLRTNHFTQRDFVRKSAKNDPYNSLALNGNITINPIQSVSLRLGGAYDVNQSEDWNIIRSYYNPDRFYNTDRQTWRGYGNWRHYLSNSTFYEIGASFVDYRGYTYPEGFSKNIEDVLFYGDIDGVIRDAQGNEVSQTPAFGVNDIARNYWEYNATTHAYEPLFGDGNVPTTQGVHGLFSLPGVARDRYTKWHNQQFRLNASATTQIGLHQIEFGGEFEQRTLREYNALDLDIAALYFNDGNVETTLSDGRTVNQWTDIPADIADSFIWWNAGGYYGYDVHGVNESDNDDLSSWAAYFQGTSNFQENENTFNIAPWRPLYIAGYIQDKIEFRDLVINLGLRADVFDNNVEVLKDPYATRPIVRASTLANIPDGIGGDYAVYYPDGNASRTPVGFRDIEGNFYDAQGNRAAFATISSLGKPAEDRNADFMSVLEDSEPFVTLMPRIGVSFPVTDQALFFASYNVLSQRPSERSYAPPQVWVGLGNEIVDNPNLKPEKTTQYELGFRQRLGDRAALQLSGFYRTQSNKIGVRALRAGLPAYTSFFNVDFSTTKGATIEFDLRRTKNLTANANYTLQFAQGTGSDAYAMYNVSWIGSGFYPNYLTAAEFDRRHTFNVMLDYRLGKGEGPNILGGRLLENFGVNVVASIRSGMPFTRFETPIIVPVSENRTPNVAGELNGVYMPWTNLVDLRVDRRFDLGGRSSLTAFLWVQNVFNFENVQGVYRGTGLPDDDGFLNSETGRDRVEGSPDPDSYLFHYQGYVANPDAPRSQYGALSDFFTGGSAYGLPRRTRLGLRFNF